MALYLLGVKIYYSHAHKTEFWYLLEFLMITPRRPFGLACVAGVRRGREKGSSSAKRDREREARSRSIVLRALCRASRSNSPSPFPPTPFLPSPSNAGHAGYLGVNGCKERALGTRLHVSTKAGENKVGLSAT